jgi:hypothetical protein
MGQSLPPLSRALSRCKSFINAGCQPLRDKACIYNTTERSLYILKESEDVYILKEGW